VAQRAPGAEAAAAAAVFISLTVGQALGAVALGLVSGIAGATAAFGTAGVLLLVATAAAERRSAAASRTPAERRSAAASRTPAGR
jgi:hypothetical protein